MSKVRGNSRNPIRSRRFGVSRLPEADATRPTEGGVASPRASTLTDAVGRAALDVIGALIVAVTPDGRIAHFNRAAEELTGYRESEVLGRPFWNLLVPADEIPALQRVLERLAGGESPVRHENDWILHHGSRHRISWTNTTLTHADGSVRWIVGTGIDVTAERRAAQLLQDVLHATTEQAVIGTDLRGVITLYNTGAERMLGFSPERVIGAETPVLFHDPEELHERARALGCSSGFDALTAMARDGAAHTQDWIYRRADGSPLPVTVSVSAMHRADGTEGWRTRGERGGDVSGYLFVAIDATARQQREEAWRSAVHEYARRALHDELTGLPNRSLLRDRLEHAIAVAARHGRYVGLLFIDLDRFKNVNDTYGHVAGDELLTKVATRIVGAARSSDTVARFGGDEFVVLCEDLHDPEELAAVAYRVTLAVAQKTVIGDTLLVPSASIGMVAVPGTQAEPDELIESADRAMYESRGVRLPGEASDREPSRLR